MSNVTTTEIVNWKDPESPGDYQHLSLEESGAAMIVVVAYSKVDGDIEGAEIVMDVVEARQMVVALSAWIAKQEQAA